MEYAVIAINTYDCLWMQNLSGMGQDFDTGNPLISFCSQFVVCLLAE